uniref:Chromosomal replication initiator protein n=1 Tax=Brugia timori TaxID=42155 RepID=A0A0R3QGY4_9BILA
LRGDGVRTGGEHLGEHGHVEARARQLQRGAHAGTAGTDDHDVELALDFPKHLNGPTRTTDQPDDGEDLEHEADRDGLDVVHPDVAHADPHVIEQRHDDAEGQDLHPLGGEDAGPQVVADRAAREDQLRQQDDREERHQGARDALAEPVAQTVAEQLGAEHDGQQDARGQREDGRALAELLGHGLVAHVHPEVAHAGDEVVQVGPDQREHHELEKPARNETKAAVEGGLELGERIVGRERGVEHPDDERQQQEHQRAADAVQDRHDAGGRQAVGREIGEGVDVAEFATPWCGGGCKLCHGGAFVAC